MPTPRYLFVRHGQCQANEQGRVAGWLDSPLTPLGREQARAAAARLARWPGTSAIASSDLTRAQDTARIIAEALGLPLHLEPGLREQSFGSMEGRPFTELSTLEAGAHHINEVRWGGGESVADVYHRLEQTLARLDHDLPGPLILVTHGHVIQIALALLRGHGPREVEWFNPPNGDVVPFPDDPADPS